jgi:hypothetical protein
MDKKNEKAIFAQMPAELKARFDKARGKGTDKAITQSAALASLIEFALPYVETIAPGKFVFRDGEVRAKKS